MSQGLPKKQWRSTPGIYVIPICLPHSLTQILKAGVSVSTAIWEAESTKKMRAVHNLLSHKPVWSVYWFYINIPGFTSKHLQLEVVCVPSKKNSLVKLRQRQRTGHWDYWTVNKAVTTPFPPPLTQYCLPWFCWTLAKMHLSWWSSCTEPCQFQSSNKDQITLSAPTGSQLGDLLFKLIGWVLGPRIIDLTGEKPETGFQPPPDTSVSPSGKKSSSKVIFLIADTTAYLVYVYLTIFLKLINIFSSSEGVGDSPCWTAFQEAIRTTIHTRGCWKVMGDTVVPETSPVTDAKYWWATGALLALVLLSGENLHPVSPIVAYALLANVHRHSEAVASMDLSLAFIEQQDSSKANTLLPWMIIPPCKDWKILPAGHQAQLLQVITNLDLDVKLNNSCSPAYTYDRPSSRLQLCQLSPLKSTQSGLLFWSLLQCLEVLTFSLQYNFRKLLLVSECALKRIRRGLRSVDLISKIANDWSRIS